MSGIPVFLKNASPKTPSMITTLAARSKIGADATNESPNERLANVPCKFVMPSRRKFEPNCSEPGSGRGFFSKYDLSMSLTFEPDKSLVSILDKTLSLKKEAKSSNKAKKIRFMLVRHLHSLK